MQVAAYVLVADPSFLRASISAYYDRVDKIVLSFDETSTSWTGTALPVEECLQIIDAMDVEGKCVRQPGPFATLPGTALDRETQQRQTALDAASVSADWVLQLDTDEVMLDPDAFFASLERADASGCSALHFPSRWLYARTAPGRYLESSSRFWGPTAGYPGALAVRSGTILNHARQTTVPTFRVDVRPWNTDPSHHHETFVHEVVAEDAAVAHFSWVRAPETMRRKFGWSGHAADYSRPRVFEEWEMRQRRPVRTVLTNPLRRRDWFRLVTISEPPGGEP